MKRLPTAAAIALLTLGACGPAPSERVSDPTPLQIAEAQPGVVLAARQISNPGSGTLADDGAGARFGGYAGLVIGSFIGEGSGRALGALIGLGAGALVGAVVENEVERETQTEYLIRLETGEEIVALTRGPQLHGVGESVRVVANGHGYATVIAI